jgi:hypothetical protein
VFDIVLLLELSMNVHRILSTFCIFKWEKYSIYIKKPVVLKVRDTCITWNHMIKVRSCSVSHIISVTELSWSVKGILPISHCFQEAETFTLRKISLNADCKQHM